MMHHPLAIAQVRLTIDDQEVQVPCGTSVYHACRKIGIDIPVFCYLDRLPPFGACRVCMVEVEQMSKPQTACTLEVKEGMVVRTKSAKAEEARRQILEFLLINHPLDCPVCDRGGECPLQDNALRYGPGMSRFFEEKRHFKKPLAQGPILMLDRERCISCARCVRFGDLIAGDHALEFIERGHKTEVGMVNEAAHYSKFIGNTIMICPVGALTSRVYRFRARPWDNEAQATSCTLCPVGCSMFLDSRDGEIVRTRAKEDGKVNDIWLCDKGWFGYEFAASANRLSLPLIRKEGKLKESSWEEALELVAGKIKAHAGAVAGFGGNALTVEENWAFQELIRKGGDSPHVDHRIGMPIFSLEEEGLPPGMEMSIADCETLSFALILGCDLTEEFPVIWLRLRSAIRQGADVSFCGYFAPEISPYLSRTVLHRPGEELAMWEAQKDALRERLKKGERGAIFVGSQYLAQPNRKAVLSALFAFQQQEGENLSLNIMEGHSNSMGARLAGMHPELAPYGKRAAQKGLDAIALLHQAQTSGWGLLYVAGANPALKFPSKLWKGAREKIDFLVVQDLFLTETAQTADVVLPTLSALEKVGSFLNIEGRLRAIQKGKRWAETLLSDLEIFNELLHRLAIPVVTRESVPLQLTQERTFFARSVCCDEKGSLAPAVVELSLRNTNAANLGKYTLTLAFAPALFDGGRRLQESEHLKKLVRPPRCRLSPEDAFAFGLQENDEVYIKGQRGGVEATLSIDKAVAPGVLLLPLGFEKELHAQEFFSI